MEANLNFEGLKMKIENYRITPRIRKSRKTNPKDYFIKEYIELKDFEKVFNMPVKPILKADVEDKLIKEGKVVEKFILPWSYSIEDEKEYKSFLKYSFEKIRNREGYKLIEIRKNNYQKAIITITKA